jgi:hypothetical protein
VGDDLRGDGPAAANAVGSTEGEGSAWREARTWEEAQQKTQHARLRSDCPRVVPTLQRGRVGR